MNYNLIFSGIPESEDRLVENCETTIKNFINKDLGVKGDAEFQNIHRLRQRVDRKPRNIIAKFTKYTDHEKVRTAAFEKLKGRNINSNIQPKSVHVGKILYHRCRL